MPSPDTQSNFIFYDVAGVKDQYSLSAISRRCSRRHLSSESTFLLSSRDCSPVRRRSPATISSYSTNSKSDKNLATNHATLKENSMPTQQNITHFDCDESTLQCSPNSSLNIRSYLRSSLPVRRSTAKLQARQQDTPSPSLSPSPIPSRFTRGLSSCGSSILCSRSDRNRSYSKTLPNPNNSSSSITLQVTARTNTDKLEPNTKIYVQNTPTHNMITFENDKLLNESNVYLINSESITNQQGELLRKTISTQNHQQQQQQQRQAVSYWQQQQQQHEHKPIPKEAKKEENVSIYNNNLINKNNFNNHNINNNINNVTTMNNNRRLSMPQTLTSTTGVHYGSTQLIYKNNVLKQHEQQPNEPQPQQQQHQPQQQQLQQPQPKMTDLVVGSLGFYEKNSYQMLSNNTLCERKNLRNSNNNNNNNNNNNHIICSSDNLAQIFLHKQMMESEPNLLAFKYNKQQQQQKYLGKENGLNSVETLATINDEIRCSFPTLTDISFNFTSLAAQKILQAVSLNSIDTLVELKQIQQHQQQHKDTASECEETTHASTTTPTTKALCTDYGLL